jgi:Flp pilus assembly protein CpaB
MNTAHIVVTIALSAGGVAAYPMRGNDNKPLLAGPDLQWQTWPAATASNSFILLNDRVDIRELATDQASKEKDGTNSLVGKTVTLELWPEQSEARARQSGTAPLALRSITDINTVESRSEDQARKRGEGVNVVRYRVASQMTIQK